MTLQFVMKAAMSHSPTLASLPEQLACVRPAAGLQLSQLNSLMEELEAGLAGVEAEVEAVAALSDGAVPRRQLFLDAMAACTAAAAPVVSRLKALHTETTASLQQLSAYFEDQDSRDPLRVFTIIRDFLPSFDKTLKAIREGERQAAADAQSAGAPPRPKVTAGNGGARRSTSFGAQPSATAGNASTATTASSAGDA